MNNDVCPVSGQSIVEEWLNAITHGIGALLAAAALTLLVVFASLHGNTWHIVSYSIFGSTLVLLYSASFVYHSTRHLKAKRILQIIDHCCIYLLIAGTYTPFTLVTLNGTWGWSLFGVVWGLALAGIVFKVLFTNRFDVLSTLFYIGMGWLSVIAFKPLVANLPTGGIILLIVGGILYTIGAIFYLLDKVPFNHAVWHLFVLAGSTCHFFAVFLFV